MSIVKEEVERTCARIAEISVVSDSATPASRVNRDARQLIRVFSLVPTAITGSGPDDSTQQWRSVEIPAVDRHRTPALSIIAIARDSTPDLRFRSGTPDAQLGRQALPDASVGE